MVWFSVVAASVAPGAALLAYFYLKDRYESEPISMVIRFFLFGALLVLPLMVIQRSFVLGLGESPFMFSFVYSAFLEEFFKWFLLFFLVYKHRQFNEPYDGIVYATAISLGFATVENVIYVMMSPFTVSTILIRALLPVSGHALFGVMMGFHLGKAKFYPHKETRHLFASLALPVAYHGLFDYIQLGNRPYWLWLMLPLMILMWARGIWKINRASAISPFRGYVREEEVKI